MPEVKKEEIHSDDVEKQFEQLRSIGKEIEKVDLEICELHHTPYFAITTHDLENLCLPQAVLMA